MDELRAPMPPALLSVLQQRFGSGGAGLPGLAELASPLNSGERTACDYDRVARRVSWFGLCRLVDPKGAGNGRGGVGMVMMVLCVGWGQSMIVMCVYAMIACMR
jgi:hypothetical protein